MAMVQHDDREYVNEWVRFGMKLGVQSLLHPFEYSKVLIQVKNIVYIFVVNHCQVYLIFVVNVRNLICAVLRLLSMQKF